MAQMRAVGCMGAYRPVQKRRKANAGRQPMGGYAGQRSGCKAHETWGNMPQKAGCQRTRCLLPGHFLRYASEPYSGVTLLLPVSSPQCSIHSGVAPSSPGMSRARPALGWHKAKRVPGTTGAAVGALTAAPCGDVLPSWQSAGGPRLPATALLPGQDPAPCCV